ncbi:hypothetical protein [Sanguibacter keddieii]|uniref:hypothetical protein n=1 Tax=Sanguibacter keddieii TaxID=60920 RepID=UPI0001B84585|nr:hypothetical protein [Sanguibacter keddieii]
MALVATLVLASWSELRVRADLGRGEVAGIAATVAHDTARVAGVGYGLAAAGRGTYDIFDRLSAGLTAIGAIAFAGFGAHSDHDPVTVWSVTVGLALLASITLMRRSAARRHERVGLRRMAGMLSYGLPGTLLGAAVGGLAWWGFTVWRGHLTVGQLAVAVIIGGVIGGAETSAPALARRRRQIGPSLGAALKISDDKLLGAEPLSWSVVHRRTSGLFSAPVPVLITLHNPPSGVLASRSDLDVRVADHLDAWEVIEASSARIRLAPASAATIAARQILLDSEGIFSAVAEPMRGPALPRPIHLEV